MQSSRPNDVSVSPRLRDLFLALRGRVRPRTALITGAFLAITAGVVFNWSVLVAAGLAPLILALLPCAAMCAIGLCANRLGGGGHDGAASGSSKSGADAELAAKPKEPGDS